MPILSHCLLNCSVRRVCTPHHAPYLSSLQRPVPSQWGLTDSDTSHHVLRFTGFDHTQAQAPPLVEYAFLTNAAATAEVSGSDVSEGMCEAPTFMEWSTMVVPTYILYPEGGNNALKVCQHHHQVVRVGHFVGLSETQGTRCSRLHRPIRLKPCNLHGRTAHSVRCATVKVVGGGPSVHACAVFLRAESGGD